MVSSMFLHPKTKPKYLLDVVIILFSLAYAFMERFKECFTKEGIIMCLNINFSNIFYKYFFNMADALWYLDSTLLMKVKYMYGYKKNLRY